MRQLTTSVYWGGCRSIAHIVKNVIRNVNGEGSVGYIAGEMCCQDVIRVCALIDNLPPYGAVEIHINSYNTRLPVSSALVTQCIARLVLWVGGHMGTPHTVVLFSFVGCFALTAAGLSTPWLYQGLPDRIFPEAGCRLLCRELVRGPFRTPHP